MGQHSINEINGLLFHVTPIFLRVFNTIGQERSSGCSSPGQAPGKAPEASFQHRYRNLR